MADRLSERDVLLLALDTHHNPGHAGAVDVFDPAADGTPLTRDRLLDLITERLVYVPRYRKRVRTVPGALGTPVWVDDADFDLSFHVRSAALPAPGTPEQLAEFVGRVSAGRLDRSRPLWELYLVEGLGGGRTALVWKTHPVLVDGIDAVDLGQLLLESDPIPDEAEESPFGTEWRPEPEPGPLGLLAGAALEAGGGLPSLLPRARRGATEALGAVVAVTEAVGGTAGAVGDLLGAFVHGGRPPTDSPLGGAASQQRRWAALDLPLARLQELRAKGQAAGAQEDTLGAVTINDIVLTVLTGALRAWLTGRGAAPRRSELVALAPMSVRDVDGEPSSLGSSVAPLLMSLPVGEPNPLLRLQQVAFDTRAYKDTGRAVGARDISEIAGFAPATLQALAVRAALGSRRRPYDLMVTNVPGPQHKVYAGTAPLAATWPVLPLAAGHLLAAGLTSYDGRVHLGLTADRDKLADLAALAEGVPDAVDELAEALDRRQEGAR
ncbi:diacylglycerol O-acyltransferase [Naumannella cuiyingiana]|uniref:Diacylglycerol O-acyltransferase n=1 Tax=Naumannella cuiyingiana TaxID=1347891 RepID=A0A7Z0D6L2_9ACTN|nr:wax ester/triacylglycerol synthase family O-acyltransferase [Naumannella cuiyingiana]NYI69833.1 diacylglycerol O-acyltransferase [Naumannella cuiyingiana]